MNSAPLKSHLANPDHFTQRSTVPQLVSAIALKGAVDAANEAEERAKRIERKRAARAADADLRTGGAAFRVSDRRRDEIIARCLSNHPEIVPSDPDLAHWLGLYREACADVAATEIEFRALDRYQIETGTRCHCDEGADGYGTCSLCEAGRDVEDARARLKSARGWIGRIVRGEVGR